MALGNEVPSMCNCPQKQVGQWKLLCALRGAQAWEVEGEQFIFAELTEGPSRLWKQLLPAGPVSRAGQDPWRPLFRGPTPRKEWVPLNLPCRN